MGTTPRRPNTWFAMSIVFIILFLAALGLLLYTENQLTGLRLQYQNLQYQYSTLQSNYTSLKSSYANLQSQYTSLQNQYNSLEAQYSSLQSQYSSLQSQYSTLQTQYSNASSLLNAMVNGMLGGSATDTVQPNSYDSPTGIYVPSGCTAKVTITMSSTGPVDVYVVGLSGIIYWAIDQYALANNLAPPYTWSYYYEYSGTYIQQTITLTPSYQYEGDIYSLLVYNPNSYEVSVTANIALNSITCSG